MDVAAHNRLWDPFVDFGPPIGMPFGLETIEDAVELADLVILGRIQDVYIGEQWVGSPGEPPEPMAYLAIEATEVLKGEPVSRREGRVEMQLGFALSMREFTRISSEPLPQGEYLWLLVHEATFRAETGRQPRESDIAPFAYFSPNEVQGVLLNADGLVEVVLADRFAGSWGNQRWPMSIRGQRFEDVVDRIREYVGGTA